MSGHHDERPVISRAALTGAALLIAITVAGSAWSRYTGAYKDEQPGVAAIEVRDLRFEDRADGAIVVYEHGEQVDVLDAGDGGFVRGVLRALARHRKVDAELGSEQPFRLVHWADGRLTLIDPATDSRVEINAFGTDNLQAFARLLTTPQKVVGARPENPHAIAQENHA